MDKKIVAYTTISHPAFSENGDPNTRGFPSAVHQLIKDGWQPFGSPFVVPAVDGDSFPWLGQALVKYEEGAM